MGPITLHIYIQIMIMTLLEIAVIIVGWELSKNLVRQTWNYYMMDGEAWYVLKAIFWWLIYVFWVLSVNNIIKSYYEG